MVHLPITFSVYYRKLKKLRTINLIYRKNILMGHNKVNWKMVKTKNSQWSFPFYNNRHSKCTHDVKRKIYITNDKWNIVRCGVFNLILMRCYYFVCFSSTECLVWNHFWKTNFHYRKRSRDFSRTIPLIIGSRF